MFCERGGHSSADSQDEEHLGLVRHGRRRHVGDGERVGLEQEMGGMTKEGGVDDAEVGVLARLPASSRERHAKKDRAVDELGVGTDDGRPELEASEKSDREQLEDSGKSLEDPEADRGVSPGAQLGDVCEAVWSAAFSASGVWVSRKKIPTRIAIAPTM